MDKTPVIEINMDKQCMKCGAKGAAQNGWCLDCIGKYVAPEPSQIYLTQDAISVARACDLKSENPKYKNVRIQNGEVIGMNGYLLARCKVDVKGKNRPLEIKADSLLRSSKPLGKTEITINTDVKKAVIQPIGKEDDGGIISINIELPETGIATNYDGVYPTTEKKAYIAFSTDLLKQLISVAGDNQMIRFKIHESDKPVEYMTGTISGIIMPLNVMEGIDADGWHKPEVTGESN